MNVYLQELKMARSSMLWWIGALVAVTMMFLAIYPAFHSDIQASQKLLAGFPPQVRAALDLNITMFLSFLGFYAYMFTYVGLAGAVQATNLGLVMLSREVSSKTTDFLLTKPASRGQIFASKLGAALTVLIITNLVLVAATFGLAKAFGAGSFDMKIFGLLCLAFWLVQLMFMSIGVLASQLIRVKSVITISLGLVFGFFALSMVQAIASDDKLRYFTPFKYFDHMNIVANGRYDMKFFWLSILVIAAGLVVGLVLYRQRDTRSET